jgi:hypothetical protein
MNPDISRRRFFLSAVDEAIASLDGLRGRPSLKLSALGDLPDAEFATLIPVFTAGAELEIVDGMVVARPSAGEPPIPLCAEGSCADHILRTMHGAQDIRGIAALMSDRWNRPAPEMFREVRQLFVDLVAKGICEPANAPEPS